MPESSDKPELTDEKVLHCEGDLSEDPRLRARVHIQKVFAVRYWSTDQILYNEEHRLTQEHGNAQTPDGNDVGTNAPRWTLTFALGLDHIENCEIDWFDDVRVMVETLGIIASETDARFTVEVRHRAKKPHARHVALIDGTVDDCDFLKATIDGLV
jgi:hypothetical protein